MKGYDAHVYAAPQRVSLNASNYNAQRRTERCLNEAPVIDPPDPRTSGAPVVFVFVPVVFHAASVTLNASSNAPGPRPSHHGPGAARGSFTAGNAMVDTAERPRARRLSASIVTVDLKEVEGEGKAVVGGESERREWRGKTRLGGRAYIPGSGMAHPRSRRVGGDLAEDDAGGRWPARGAKAV